MKRLSLIYAALIGAFLSAASPVLAQQETFLFSQYMFNRLVMNPAYAGCKENVSVTALYRHQWTGFDGAPKTFSISGHGSFAQMKMGVGAYIMNDMVGPLRYTTFAAQYAYRLRLAESTFLSFGLNVGLQQFAIKKSDITTLQAGDQVLNGADESSIRPDFGFGIFFNTRNLYVGISTNHLVEFNYGLSGASDAKMARTYFLTAGVDIKLGGDVILTPSVSARYVQGAMFSADLNANLMFIQKFWVGAGYRTQDAVVFMAGFYPHRQFRVGYSYDLGVSKLRSAHSGSHEIMLSFEFGNPNKSRVVTPRYF